MNKNWQRDRQPHNLTSDSVLPAVIVTFGYSFFVPSIEAGIQGRREENEEDEEEENASLSRRNLVKKKKKKNEEEKKGEQYTFDSVKCEFIYNYDW